MPRYKMSDVVVEINERENNPAESKYERFVGLEHYVSGEVIIRNFGSTERLESTMKVFQSGDILVARRNVYLKRAATVDFDGLTSGDSIVLRPTNYLIGRILPFVLNTDAFWDFADRYSDGTMSKRLSPKTLMKYEFDLPNDDELSLLADTLWAANDTREAYQELLRQSDELVKSQFIELFGDPQKNSYHWPKVKLKDCLVRIDSGKSITCETFSRTGYLPAVLKLSAVTYGEYNANENKQLPDPDLFVPEAEVKAGDLLFSRKNTLEYVGMSALVKDTPPYLMLPDLIFRLVPRKNICPQYLHQLINHSQYRSTISNLATGTAGSMPNISKQKLLELEIPLPPIEDQRRIEPIVEQLDKSKYFILHLLRGWKRR